MKKFIILALLFYSILWLNLYPQDQTKIVDDAISAVGLISDEQDVAFGSGFFISENIFITNFHVVQSLLRKVKIKMNNGKTYNGNVLAKIEEKDLAIVKITEKAPIYLKLASPSSVHVSLPVYTIGNPSTSEKVFQFSVTEGIVSNTKTDQFTLGGEPSDSRIYLDAKVIYHTATINKGNSGGPLIYKKNGAVFGVNSFYYNNVNNMYFAIHVQELRDFLDKNGIKYETLEDTGGNQNSDNSSNQSTTKTSTSRKYIIIFSIIGGVIIIGIVITFVVLSSKKKNAQKGIIPNVSGTSPGKIIPDAYLQYGTNKYKVTDKDLVIGREPGNDIMIPDLLVSRRHCIVSYEGNNFFIKDLSSKNGTIVNDKKITNTILRSGDIIKVGVATITFSLNKI